MSYEQITFMELLAEKQSQIDWPNIRNVGDVVCRIVLGEVRTARITEIERLSYYPHYFTDSGSCYSYEEGLNDLEKAKQQAEENRKKFETIEPKNLERRLTVEYPPDYPGGKTLWAQIGVFQGMLFWKESITYQFLECCENDKKLLKKYEEHKKKILEAYGGSAVIVPNEHPMRRLYRSRSAKGYADAEYVKFNY